MPVINRIADYHAEMAEWRLQIHAHPEIAFRGVQDRRDGLATPATLSQASQAAGPNSTSTGVGVLTSVLKWSLPLAGFIRKTAMLSVFWLAA
jgi:hypothetical protein